MEGEAEGEGQRGWGSGRGGGDGGGRGEGKVLEIFWQISAKPLEDLCILIIQS